MGLKPTSAESESKPTSQNQNYRVRAASKLNKSTRVRFPVFNRILDIQSQPISSHYIPEKKYSIGGFGNRAIFGGGLGGPGGFAPPPQIPITLAQENFSEENERIPESTETSTNHSVTEKAVTEAHQTEEAVTEESQTEQPCYDGAHLDTDPGIPFCDSYQKREIVRNWIENFPHNETHMSIVHNNNTLSLVTLNELPDQDYQKCDSPHDQDVTLMCKSIWHCDLKISRETLTTQPFNLDRICIIEERYVGFCCEEPKSE